MRILMTVNAAWNIWNFRRPVVEALLADGHQVIIAAPVDNSVADLEALGCKFIPLEMNAKGLNPLDGVSMIGQFRRIIRSAGIELVLSYTIKNNLFGAIAAKSLRIPFIPNVTGLGTAFLSGRLLQFTAEQLYRTAFRSLPVVFFQNEDDLALFLERGLVQIDQAKILPGSGIDLDRFPATPFPIGDETKKFLMISRLLRDKGVVEYVDAARMIRQRHPGTQFQLLGPLGSENRTSLHLDRVKAWVDEGIIDYLGTTDDVRPLIERASCVVLPSYREGAPRTLIEAAAMARPIITTDVPGCRSVLESGISGYLCKARSASSLVASIERFLSLSDEAQAQMGLSGREKMVSEFDQAIVVQAYRSAIAGTARN
ncbi:glycosyltransferase family 4 protein [Henriciella marina]|uniref:Glycosyltransferase family 4 protein n=1 Tax=Henriciella marina TaxID=453851 RepID=A0ABT4LU63_9PROT|nr:glycosyltransferase family 4 protein [Henriciella marina]MCZ4297906.1 glycosyltransferase family 4 protein [Henriciella marina]